MILLNLSLLWVGANHRQPLSSIIVSTAERFTENFLPCQLELQAAIGRNRLLRVGRGVASRSCMAAYRIARNGADLK
ncbi:hypothetical protein C8F01DRAFT_275610 [Mycena amicta]|nr:hypothetical protein C8F01DRAFT_275610 [Mycena amicta]